MKFLLALQLHATVTSTVKIFAPAAISFIIGMLITPAISKYLYKKELWKKASVLRTIDGREATISGKLHDDGARKTPRMGGVIVWASVIITTIFMAFIAYVFPSVATLKLSFLSRGETWLPLFTLIVGSLVGLADDILVVAGKDSYIGGGLSLKKRLLVVLVLAVVGAWWFYVKLGTTGIHIPFEGNFNLGIAFIPFFILTMLALYSGGIIDGVDGLAGGVFTIMFAAYAVIAYSQNQVNLAAFCMVVVGGLLVFLWFNIPPARFFLSETGTMGLTTTLTVIAFLTGQIFVLPIIALPLVATTGSVILQLLSKRFRGGKKIFMVAPLHNHYMAKGWPSYKVTMRYWIFSIMCAVIGIVFALIS